MTDAYSHKLELPVTVQLTLLTPQREKLSLQRVNTLPIIKATALRFTWDLEFLPGKDLA